MVAPESCLPDEGDEAAIRGQDLEPVQLRRCITLLSAENLRSAFVWKWFMRHPEMARAMELAGLEEAD